MLAQSLYINTYQKKNGFVPLVPSGVELKVGDFFLVEEEGIVVLGNIWDSYFKLAPKYMLELPRPQIEVPVTDPEKPDEPRKRIDQYHPRNPDWELSVGGRSEFNSNLFKHKHKYDELAPEFNAYGMYFKRPGGFYYLAEDVSFSRLSNFDLLSDELIRRFTAGMYNFTNLNLVTELAHAKHYSLMLAQDCDAEVVFATDKFQQDMKGFLKRGIPKVERACGMAFTYFRQTHTAIAFKAKKLRLSANLKDQVFQRIQNSADEDIHTYIDNLLKSELVLLPNFEISLPKVVNYFEWAEFGLSDSLKLSRTISE